MEAEGDKEYSLETLYSADRTRHSLKRIAIENSFCGLRRSGHREIGLTRKILQQPAVLFQIRFRCELPNQSIMRIVIVR